MNANLKLYQSNGSPNSRRVRIFLAEKGVTLTQVAIDLGAKEQFSDAYVAINPRRVVPTLVLEDGTVIGEVPAIMRYLDEAFPTKPLLGADAKEKAVIQMWERRMELEGFAAVMETVRNRAAGLKGRAIAGPHDYEQIPALVDRGMERVKDFYTDLEARLNEQPFVAGPALSAADITAFVTIGFATNALQLAIPEANAATSRWYNALAARESFSA
ncbi:glutathione S-transferase family protein [Rhizobium sp. NZLR1]|uniref:glutathione S-transferase family protein n=1 Tax=Rhizobium sp. NZLR1 TaxID=2731096 RepID=UPI001A983357|nr:glutathione S-transferase family protein [Rhizobium sp. NZLR1]MBX5204139.1 glutathione S-transferase family protein [Rhizobium sp. NZLR1]QSZ25289.1 glutathione S-transferase family protein [Rhizobium sp. NZLR1]